jgi:hypothetical protein
MESIMKKEDVLREIERCENGIKSAYERLDALEKENIALRELVHHLASRPSPYVPPKTGGGAGPPSPYVPPTPYIQPTPWPEGYKMTYGTDTN